MSEAARWSVMDRETRALIERARRRYQTEDEFRELGTWAQQCRNGGGEVVEETDKYGAQYRCRYGWEQDRQAGADESKDKTETEQ